MYPKLPLRLPTLLPKRNCWFMQARAQGRPVPLPCNVLLVQVQGASAASGSKGAPRLHRRHSC